MDEFAGMRGNFFCGHDYLRPDPKTGIIRTRNGRRMVTLDIDFLQGFREGFEIECGEAADAVMATCGREYGYLFARQLDADLTDYYEMSSRRMALAMFAGLLEQAMAQHGWGRVSLDPSGHSHGFLVATVSNPIYSSMVQKSSRPVEPLLAGFLAGVFSYYSETKLDCLQTSCMTQGDDVARFVISAPERVEACQDAVLDGKTHADIVSMLTQPAAEAVTV